MRTLLVGFLSVTSVVFSCVGCQPSEISDPTRIEKYTELSPAILEVKSLGRLSPIGFPSTQIKKVSWGELHKRRTQSATHKQSVIVAGESPEREVFLVQPVERTKMNISNNERDDACPSISSDGKRIVFVSNRDGNSAEVYLVDLEDRTLTNISNSPIWDGEPTISSDGDRIAFVTMGPAEGAAESIVVQVLDVPTQRLLRIPFPTQSQSGSASAYYAQISPDGRKVRFQEHLPVFSVSGLEVLGHSVGSPRVSRLKGELYEADLDLLDSPKGTDSAR